MAERGLVCALRYFSVLYQLTMIHSPNHSLTPILCRTAGFLGQMGPTADGAKSQAQSTAQAVKSQAGPATEAVKSQASPAADAVKSQAQDLAPSKVESVTQGLQPPAPTGTAVNSAKAAGEQLQSQLKSSSDLIPGTGNVSCHLLAI